VPGGFGSLIPNLASPKKKWSVQYPIEKEGFARESLFGILLVAC